MTYSSLIYKTTQLCGLLRVEPHPRSCIAKLQVLRKGSSNGQRLEGLKGVKLLFQRGEKDLKSGKKVFKIMNDKEVGLQASVLAKIQNQLNCKAEKLRLDERNTFQFRTCTRLWKMLQQNAVNLIRAEIPFFNYVENKAGRGYF